MSQPVPESTPPSIGHSWRAHGFVLLIYTLLALALTWPLPLHLATHVTGNAIDDPALAWNLWWVKYSLIDLLNADIFHVGWMFHPVDINLAFYTLTPLNGLLSIPLQGAFGLVVANNLLLLSSFVLGAYGTWLVVHWLLTSLLRSAQEGVSPDTVRRTLNIAALLAGFVYAFAAPKLFYAALGQFNIASTQWIPFCVFYMLRMAQARTAGSALRSGAMVGLFLLFQAWAELTYASFLLIFAVWAAIFALVQTIRAKGGVGRLLAGWATAGIVFTLGMMPILWAMLPDLSSEGNFFASAAGSSSGGGFADLFSADLAGYLLPTRMHPLLGDWVASLPFPNQYGQQIFLGWLTVGLAVAGFLWLWRRERGQALFWGGATLLFWLLTLGPRIRWMGVDTPIPGPFALVSLLPFFNGNRYPSRYGVVLLLCIAVLAAAGAVAVTLWLLRKRWARPALTATTAAVAALLLFEHSAGALPLTDFRIASIYSTLAAQPGDRAILELPTGWRNGARVLGRSSEVIMMQQWYQTAHAKRRLGGNTSRNPQQKFQYFTEHPLIGDLIPLMNADDAYLTAAVDATLDETIARHAPIAAQEFADLGVSWVTVDLQHATPQLLRFVEEALPLTLLEEWQGTDWRGDSSTIRLYAVAPPGPVAERAIDLAAETGAAFLDTGWSTMSDGSLRFATRSTASLLLPIEAGDSLGFSGTGEATILLNGKHLAYTAGDDFSISVPPALATEPIDRLTIRFASRGTPVTALAQQPSSVGETGATLAAGVTLAVRSAAEQVGDFAQIWLNGENVAPGGRGYNLAALTTEGALVDSAHFDTFASEEESARMAAWIQALPAGTIVAGAVADEASLHLTQEAVDALATLGVASDLRGNFRWSHAFIGMAGAPASSAIEKAGVLRPAGVWLGAPVDGASVYGALGTLTIARE